MSRRRPCHDDDDGDNEGHGDDEGDDDDDGDDNDDDDDFQNRRRDARTIRRQIPSGKCIDLAALS